jgi:hypothetical protein
MRKTRFDMAKNALRLHEADQHGQRLKRMQAEDDYQRSKRGPIAAPATVGMNKPGTYQIAMNGAPRSRQCSAYTAALTPPASKPAAAS